MKSKDSGSEDVLRQGIIFTCNNERILQIVHNGWLFLSGFRNIHPFISPQILDCHMHILSNVKQGESIVSITWIYTYPNAAVVFFQES